MAAGENQSPKGPPDPGLAYPAPAATDEKSTAPLIISPKLTAAQLKEKKKAEKAARRAAEKLTKPSPVPPAGTSPAQNGGRGSHKEGSQPKGSAQPQSRPGIIPHRPSMAVQRPADAKLERDARSLTPKFFSHLPMAKRIPFTQAHKDVHPATLMVGQQMATFIMKDNMARLEATMLAFRKVIKSYQTPRDSSLSRHFVPHVLNHQIDYLSECRPMCFAMGNAIRMLKEKATNLDIDTPEDEAKEVLLEFIDTFMKERISEPEKVISANGADMIHDGDVILTYGRHRLVEMTMRRAKEAAKYFHVLIVDDPYDPTGKHMAHVLSGEGIGVTYFPHLGGLGHAIEGATCIFLGAEAFFANGALYAPTGTAEIAMAAKHANKAVYALCETINFDKERVAIDAITYNEIDPERHTAHNFRLLFDTTQERHVTAIITEYETETSRAPSQTILSILSGQERRELA